MTQVRFASVPRVNRVCSAGQLYSSTKANL